MASVDDLHQMLGRCEAKLDILVDRDADKEQRLRSVERRQWGTIVASVMLAPLAAKLGLHWPMS